MRKSYRILLLLLMSASIYGCGVIGFSSQHDADSQVSSSSTDPPFAQPDKNAPSTREDATNVGNLPSLSVTSPVFLEDGVASWYGPNFNGKKTANGETYDMYGLTAAHRTLAFNSKVRVTNLDNGKSIVVRVNDRGPYAKSRIIDLSKKAAQDLDMIQAGTARVRLELVEGKKPDLSTFCSLCETYGVQLGSFKNAFDAEILKDKIEGAYVHSGDVNGKLMHRVIYGAYTSKSDAEEALTKLKRKGFDGFVRQLENL